MDVLSQWWQRLRGDVPGATNAPWFGITDLDIDGHPRPHLYVAGCPSFAAEDETAEWATEYVWWPEDRYVDLASVGITSSGLHREVLANVAAAVKRLAPWEDVDVAGVAVGFDDGDFEVLWPVG